jgi:hypothetical protein
MKIVLAEIHVAVCYNSLPLWAPVILERLAAVSDGVWAFEKSAGIVVVFIISGK